MNTEDDRFEALHATVIKSASAALYNLGLLKAAFRVPGYGKPRKKFDENDYERLLNVAGCVEEIALAMSTHHARRPGAGSQE